MPISIPGDQYLLVSLSIGRPEGLERLFVCSWSLISGSVLLSVQLIFLGAANGRRRLWQLLRLVAGAVGLWFGICRLPATVAYACPTAHFQKIINWSIIIAAALTVTSSLYQLWHSEVGVHGEEDNADNP